MTAAMESPKDLFKKFWAQSFNLEPRDFDNDSPRIVTSGRYVEKFGKEYFFLFQSFSPAKRVMAGTREIVERLGLTEKNLQSEEPFAGLGPAFHDLDYGFNDIREFKRQKPISGVFQKLSSKEEGLIGDFYSDVSEDDRDTLDLTFKNEEIWALLMDQKIVGISRSGPVIGAPSLGDITVVVRERYRGQGFGAPLVSKVVEELLSCGKFPRYRVNKDLLASQAIAEKLGLRRQCAVLSFPV